MHIPLRSLAIAAALAVIAAVPLGAAAQGNDAANWPSRPITLVIPYPPGGTSDVVGRQLGLVLRPGRAAAGGVPGAGPGADPHQVARGVEAWPLPPPCCWP